MKIPILERRRPGHCLSRLINEWEYVMHRHFMFDIDEAIEAGTEIPDPEEMLEERRRIEQKIMKLSN